MAETGAPPGISSAIASGQAMGDKGGKGFSGGLQSVIPAKGLAEAGFLKDVNYGSGFSLETAGKGGLGGFFEGAIRPDSPLKGLFDMFEGKADMFKNTMGGGSASSGGDATSGSGGGGAASGGSGGSDSHPTSASAADGWSSKAEQIGGHILPGHHAGGPSIGITGEHVKSSDKGYAGIGAPVA